MKILTTTFLLIDGMIRTNLIFLFQTPGQTLVIPLLFLAFLSLVLYYVSKGNKKNKSNPLNSPVKQAPPIEIPKLDEKTNVSFSLSFNPSTETIGKYLIFDIETGGLSYDDDILQISWLLLDEFCNEITSNDYYIKNTKPIDPKSTEIHGITEEILLEKGVDWEIAAKEFMLAINNCKFLVAHNIEFDYPFVKYKMPEIPAKKLICTMKKGTDFCQIPNSWGRGYKWPKLTELVSHLFFDGRNVTINEAHDAHYDMLLTAKCFVKMRELAIIKQ